MSDWRQLSREERELVESCGPSEVCILFGDHGLHKLDKRTWSHIYGEACGNALRAALANAGVEFEFEAKELGGWSFKTAGARVLFAHGENFWDWNPEDSTITVRIRAPDGTEGMGVAHITPPGRTH